MKMTPINVNPRLEKAEYAVRGALALRAEELKRILKDEHNLSFDKVINCNIGNPQQLGQPPLTFLSQILSLMEAPPVQFDILKNYYPKDVVDRVLEIKQHILHIGAYSHSKGYEFIRKQICKFIQSRDCDSSGNIDVERIFLTNGASEGISRVLTTMANEKKNYGVMIPIPQYPLYKAELILAGFEPVDYYMTETAQGWTLNNESIQKSLSSAKQRDIKVLAMVLINPGNPTGNCLNEKELKEILSFARDNDLTILADEVYQDNTYQQSKFTSCRKAAIELGIYSELNLFSFHSVSKGLLGECGRRGGYIECSQAIPDHFIEQLYKLSSLSLSPNTQGQVCVWVMTNPPEKESKQLWDQERLNISESLQRRAYKLYNAFNSMKGYSCAPALGSMYLFPKITFPEQFITKCLQDGKQCDQVYAMELLNETGVCMIPGSGFGQGIGSFHVRCTFLPREDDFDDFIRRIKEFNEKFMLTCTDELKI